MFQLNTRNGASNLGLIGAAITGASSLLGGCAGNGPAAPHFSPPPQESITEVAPGVSRAQAALSKIINTGAPINVNDGVNYDEAWRLMSGYVLRRSDLSAQTLGDGAALNEPTYGVIRDAQLFSQLGVILEPVLAGNANVPKANVNALELLSVNDRTLVAGVHEGEILAKNLADFLTSEKGSTVETRYILKLAGIFASDLNQVTLNKDITGDAVKRRLQEDYMVVQWLKVCAAHHVSTMKPQVKTLLSTYNQSAGATMHGDADMATGLATWETAFAALLPEDQRNRFVASPQEARGQAFVLLMRTLPAGSFTGNNSITPSQPTTEQIGWTTRNFGSTK